MKKLITMLALAAIGSTALAYSPLAVKSSLKGTEILRSPSRTLDSRIATRADNEVEYHEVNPIFLIPENSPISPHSFQYACSPDGSQVFTRWEDNGFLMVPWMIPTGVYDFLFIFESPEGKMFVAMDNVTVDADMEIEVNPEDAKVNHIQWKPCLPDGTLPQSDGETVSTGCSAITHAGVGAPLEMFIFEVAAGETEGEYRDFQKEADFWINDCTKYAAGQTMHVAKDGVQYHILLPAHGITTQTISNDPAGFASYKLASPDHWEDIIGESSPLTYPYINLEWSWGNEFMLGYKELNRVDCEEYISEIQFCAGSAEPGWEFGVKPGFDIFASDYDWMNYGIEVSPMNFSSTGTEFYTEYSTQSPGDDFIATYRYNSEGLRPYLNNPLFALPENAKPVFGASAPIVVFTRPDAYFGYSYVGRYGEIRSCDYLGQSFAIKNNGQQVWDNYLDNFSFYWTDDWEPGVAFNPGTWDYEISASNLTVDGLKATTSCTMHFENAENASWPTLTALQFRDMDNSITDRFNAPADGLLRFTGGEWTAEGRFFNCEEPAQLTVEYAPYGADDFTELECTEDPAQRFMPLFGNCYDVDLGQVSRSSDSKWYGLRVTIVDHEGNSQTQTITPAFKIEDQSGLGISSPAELSKCDVRVVGHTIHAPEGSRICNLMGEPTDGVMVESGIYIIHYEGKSLKVLVK